MLSCIEDRPLPLSTPIDNLPVMRYNLPINRATGHFAQEQTMTISETEAKWEQARAAMANLRDLIDEWRTTTYAEAGVDAEEEFLNNLHPYDASFLRLIIIFAAIWRGDHTEAMYNSIDGMTKLILDAHKAI